MSDTIVRDEMKLPDIEFRWPDCPICGEGLDLDEWWQCNTCAVTWNRNDGRNARFLVTDKPACGHAATLHPWSRQPVICRLHQGHDRYHAGYEADVDQLTYVTASWELWDDDEKPRGGPI